MNPRSLGSRALFQVALSLVVMLGVMPMASTPAAAQSATFTSLKLQITNARSVPNHPIPSYLQVANGPTTEAVTAGQPILAGTHYTWVINEDNVGDPTQAETLCRRATNPNYPQGCNWPAIHAVPGGSPVVAQGDETTLSATTAISSLDPQKKYLISVMADGYKIDGLHFSLATATSDTLTIQAQPFPLPLATVQIQVVEDRASPNGENDIPDEDTTPAHTMAGFEGHINDIFGIVSNDWYGNPLCTEYQKNSDGTTFIDPSTSKPVVTKVGGKCLSTTDGLITIPNLGPNRYTSTVVPPNGTAWVQTSTLEGNHDWDTWVQEGDTGLDTERIVNGEPVPALNFTFVCPTAPFPATPGATAVVHYATDSASVNPSTPSLPCSRDASITAQAAQANGGAIKGRVWGNKVYVPPTGGLPYPSSGYAGAKLDQPISDAWLALSDINNGDQLVYMGRAAGPNDPSPGSFNIANVPNGDYTLTIWDESQEYLLDLFNVTVSNNHVVDLGNEQLSGWWTTINGHVFVDSNGNGKMDTGEQPVSNLLLTIRSRGNNVFPQGSNTATTDANGFYEFREAYPFGAWMVEELYNDRIQTTGITFQADNQPTETTILGSGVDVNILDIIGLSGRLDWGVKPYAANTNGGIVGTVSYDATRNELDPRYAVSEDYQPGVGGIPVDLYAPVPCTDYATNALCKADPNGTPGHYFQTNADGSLAKGTWLNRYISESWQRPQNCIARDVNNSPIDYAVLPADKVNSECIEAPMQGVQFGSFPTGDPTHPLDFTTTVDGNYAFGDGCFTTGYDPTANNGQGGCASSGTANTLPAGDYIISVAIPKDAQGKDLYQVTKEEDVNVFNGDLYVPQTSPPACTGALHTVNVVSDPALAHFDPQSPGSTSGVYNPGFLVAGGSQYQGQMRPLCDSKIVHLANGRSSAQNFNLFTPTPIPGRLFGLVTDDLNLSYNPQDVFFGEKAGIPNMAVGIYDFSNRLVTTIQTDPQGMFEVLLPSTSTYNCPLPAGPCPNIYRLVANDPGQPGHPNVLYNPQFRTIATDFEVWPGQVIPADLAPTQIGVTIEAPGSTVVTPAQCALNDPTKPATVPEFFTVDKPYGPVGTAVTINGQGFGSAAGKALLDGSPMGITSWSDNQIVATVPAGTAAGPHQLKITSAANLSTQSGLTYHVTGAGYSPTLITVNAPNIAINTTTNFATIQDALNAAAGLSQALVVVYPGPTSQFNPLGVYNENVIIRTPVKLQGIGSGGTRSDGSHVSGSIIDGTGFGTDAPRETNWFNLLNTFTWTGNPNVYDGQVVYVLDQTGVTFGSSYKAAIDGLQIQGGDQLDFPGNLTGVFGIKIPGPTATVATQGGGIYVNGGANNLQITNNVLQSNGGSYGGAIRLGTPDFPAGGSDNDHVRIANNRIIANGGTNRAGGVGIFAGSTNYEVAGNDVCGNFSAEYGGGISHYGLSGGGAIHDNRIWFNRSYDEGGGLMVAGELAIDPNAAFNTTNGSHGAGAVNIYNNLIQSNLANDDGGGVRFLMGGTATFNVYNNMIVNNLSTHEGGGIALDDTPHARIFNNTIMKNITTATASTSNGLPAPAGLSTAANSVNLKNADSTAGTFSNPLLFNDIFSDNRAGTWDPASATVAGIGLVTGETLNHWDAGTSDGTGLLSPTNSIYDSSASNGSSLLASPTNKVGVSPGVVQTYDTTVSVLPWRNNPTFVGAAVVALNLPVNLLGNYHLLNNTSPAFNAGAASASGVGAPTLDIDHDARPALGGYDIGADEIRGATADLAVSKTDGVSVVAPNDHLTYTISVTNLGPDPASGATLTDTMPANLTGVTWACSATTGSSCATGSGSGSISTLLNLQNGGVATFTVAATVVASPSGGAVVNTATAATPAGTADSVAGNNSSTDTDAINVALPALGLLDNFNRFSANNLGGNWSQSGTGGGLSAAIRVVNTSFIPLNGVASAASTGQAIWNVPTTGFGATQGAAFTFANTTLSGAALILKASGGSATAPTTFIRVQYQTASGGQVQIATTANGSVANPTYTTVGTLAGSFANGDTLTAAAYPDGTVSVWKTSGATVTFLGSASTTFTGSGRIGMQLPNGARVDNFSGGTIIPPVSLPSIGLLDNFARANANTLGGNWSQATGTGNFICGAGQSPCAAIRVNAGQAFCATSGFACIFGGQAIWNSPASGFGNKQGAALTFANGTVNNVALILKATGGTTAPSRFIRVLSNGGQVTIDTTINSGMNYTSRGALAGSFASGDTLSAVADANGTVFVWKTSGATTTFLGSVDIPSFAGAGRIGVQLPSGARLSSFSGATLP